MAVSEEPTTIARAVMGDCTRVPRSLGITPRTVAAKSHRPSLGHRERIAYAEHEVIEPFVDVDRGARNCRIRGDQLERQVCFDHGEARERFEAYADRERVGE